jgi:hypothetical protein
VTVWDWHDVPQLMHRFRLGLSGRRQVGVGQFARSRVVAAVQIRCSRISGDAARMPEYPQLARLCPVHSKIRLTKGGGTAFADDALMELCVRSDWRRPRSTLRSTLRRIARLGPPADRVLRSVARAESLLASFWMIGASLPFMLMVFLIALAPGRLA